MDNEVTKKEMRIRLRVIIESARLISECSLSKTFNPSAVTKQMQDIKQYISSVEIDLRSLEKW